MVRSVPRPNIETTTGNESISFVSSSCRFHSTISPQRNTGEFVLISPIKELPSVRTIC